MADATWEAVDEYFDGLLENSDAVLDAAVNAAREAGLPQIQVAPNQGKLLNLLARTVGAQRILEVGTLGGYSAIWLARALTPGGRLITLEIDPRHADVARANLRLAGLLDHVEIRVGPALEAMQQLIAGGSPQFQLVFIDADKERTAEYFSAAVELTSPGGLIVVDNVVRRGTIIDPDDAEPAVRGMRRFNEVLAAERRVSATVVQTVGVKGYDGFALARVNETA